MEFVPILVLLLLAFPIIAIVALVKVVNLTGRLSRIEERFSALEARLAGPHAAAAPSAAAPLPGSPPVSAQTRPEVLEQVAEIPPQFRDGGETPEAIAAAASQVDGGAIPPDTTVPPAAPPPQPPPPPTGHRPGFEEFFGTRGVVWVGGLALALGGFFLVKFSIEAGLIGPGVRIMLGALLAAGLIAGGEWLRRKEKTSGRAGVPAANIPSILTAAGTSVAYATVWAAYELYGFLSPGAAFLLLGIVALATLAAALLHGPWLGGLGLVGGYVTPILVSAKVPNYWALYVYIAVVSAAAFALARLRLWRWLALTAVGFSFIWMLFQIDNMLSDALWAHAFHSVVGFALVAALIVSGLLYGPSAEPGKIDWISSTAVAVYLIGAALFVLATRHETMALTVFTLLMLATLAVAWQAEAASAAVPVAALFAVLVILNWAFEVDVNKLIAPPGAAGAAAPQPLRAGVSSHLLLGGAYGALFLVAGFLAQGRSLSARVPILWSASGVFAPVFILVALYCRIANYERSIPFAFIALALAALFSYATEQLTKRDPRPGLASSTALYATGAVAALCLAFTFALEKGWLTIGLALMVPGIAWVNDKRPLPMLRWLAGALVGIVVLRTAWEPRIVGDDIGTTPIFKWLLYGYGAPAAAFWVAGHLLRSRADDASARAVDTGAIVFTVLTAFLEIRHYATGGDIYDSASDLAEIALQVSVGLAMAIGLERLRARTRSVVHDVAAVVVAGLALAGIVLGLMIAQNPLVTGEPVGGALFNLILLGYGLPAVLAIALALVARTTRPMAYRAVAAVTSVALALTFLSLEVARAYQGPVVSFGPVSPAEQYTYSAVWLAFGVVLLLAGIALASKPARLASAAVLLLTVAKVFVVDMDALTGVWRALSFIGLGLVLVGIGYLYQRLLFPRRGAAAAPP